MRARVNARSACTRGLGPWENAGGVAPARGPGRG